MIREAHVTIGGRRTRYLEAGAGWPVVLIHAFPLNADMWRRQLEHAPDGWRLIAPDVRGFGKTPAPSSPTDRLTMDDLAGDVAALLDQLEIEDAVIGGLSMGGYITLALFRIAPARFQGMILADTQSQPDTPDGREARCRMIELVRARGASAVADQMLPKLLGAGTARTRPQLLADVRRMIESAPVSAIAGALEAMMDRPDSTSALERIPCPVLVMVGEEDTLTPVADAESMQQRITRSRLVVLPEAGHLANLESPDVFSKALTDFLRANL